MNPIVLAYLEDALRVKSPFFLVGADKQEMPASIHSVNDDNGSFRLLVSGTLSAPKDDKIAFTLIHESLRLGATTNVMESRTGVVVLRCPSDLELKERRRSPRAKLNPKEGASVSAFQELLEGVALSGALENLSCGGFKMRVENAISISTEKRLVLGTNLVSPGQIFRVIRLNKVPKCPAEMEVAGKVVSILYDQAGLTIGFAFEKLPAETVSAIETMISSRTVPFPKTVPPKARRPKKEEEKPAPDEESVVGAALEPSVPEPVPEPPAAAAPAKQAPEPTVSASQPVQDRSGALLRLKKKTRSTIVYSPSCPSGFLKRFLVQRGFERIMIAASIQSLLDYLREPNPGVLFIDWEGATEEAIELMRLLTNAFEKLPPVILATRFITKRHLLDVSNAGFSDLIEKPYACDESLAALLESQFMTKG